jgi:hypothetical protein
MQWLTEEPDPVADLLSKAKEAVVRQTATGYLTQHGLRILATNWRCRDGAADVIGRPVVTAPAVVGRDGGVRADGWLPDFVRLGELERHLGGEVIEETVSAALAEGRLKSLAPIHSARSISRKLRPQSSAKPRQAFRYGSQSCCRKAGGPTGILPSPRSVFSALVSATVNLSGRQVARITLPMAGPKR